MLTNHMISWRAFIAAAITINQQTKLPFALAFAPHRAVHSPRAAISTSAAAAAAAVIRRPQSQSPSSTTVLHGSAQSDENMKLVELQKKKAAESSSSSSDGKPINIDSLSDHLAHQRDTFDSLADFFDSEEATPDDVRPILQSLVGRSLARMLECQDSIEDGDEKDDDGGADKTSTSEYHILDIGCGVGALFPYYVEAADALDIRLKVTGIDLSPEMTALAKSNADDLMAVEKEEEESGGADAAASPKHTFDVVTGDFVELLLGADYYELNDGVGYENDDTNKYRSMYDAVVVNACYGNFYDQDALLAACAQSLKPDGVACVTHPLGAGFVEKLHEESPDTVPNVLPQTKDAFDDLCFTQALNPIEFVENIGAGEGQDGGYFACAVKTPHKALSNILKFRGTVATGYGRGGKKLGFPTANLPSSLFAEALADVRTGVYFGWAVIESPVEDGSDGGAGYGIPHKAVVNVGYSPTFEGKENAEKIIEAHLMPESELSDFYGQKMRLLLGGFLRPERKFPSFPDLIAAINNDVVCAKQALDLEPFIGLKAEQFVAGSGADNEENEEASWATQEWC